MNYEKLFVSVVIPVYNVEKYLVQCLHSILAQTYDKYEVILVDDGSTDRSGKICDEFAALDKRIHAFHKKNGGLSDARNFGVEHSEGEYIIFVDSDDYVSDDYVEYLVKLKVSFNADLATVKLTMYYGDDYTFSSKVTKEQCVTSEDALIKMMYREEFNVSAVAKIYPKEILLAHPYPVGVLYEDLATSYKIFADCKTVAYGDKEIYCYRMREGSITRQIFNKKHLYGILAAKEELKYIEQNFPNAINAARYSLAHIIIGLVDILLRGTEKNRSMFYYLRNELKPYIFFVVNDKNVKMTRKVRCIAIMLGYSSTKTLWKFIDLLNCYKKQISQKKEKNVT